MSIATAEDSRLLAACFLAVGRNLGKCGQSEGGADQAG